MNPILEALEALEVRTAEPSPRFVDWLANRNGGWGCLNEFEQYVPSAWTHLVRDDCDICYLFGSEQIMETSTRAEDCGLIVIGALMDGSLLALHAANDLHMEVGKISLSASLGKGTFGLADYTSFPMDYPAWLKRLILDPRDNSFL